MPPLPLEQSTEAVYLGSSRKARDSVTSEPMQTPACRTPQRHGDRSSGDDDDAPRVLPTFVRFADLRGAGLVSSWQQLNAIVRDEGFPPGRMLSKNVRAWTVDEVMAWLATRPTARKIMPEGARPHRRKRGDADRTEATP
jgi:hypothetical protein